MYKKVAFLLTFFLTLASIVIASPLTDFSPGKVAVDIKYLSNLKFNGSDNYSANIKTDGVNDNMDYVITAGLSNKIGIRYEQANFEFNNNTIDKFCAYSVKNKEFAILYKVNKNINTFLGWHRGSRRNLCRNLNSASNDYIQFGIIGKKKISNNLDAYGLIDLSNDYKQYEIGLGYKIAKNIDINLFYYRIYHYRG